MNHEITKEQFEEWRAHPVTAYVADLIRDKRAGNAESVAEVAAQITAERALALANWRAGYIAALDDVLTIEYHSGGGYETD